MAVTEVNRSGPALSPTPSFGNRSVRTVLPAQAEPCGQRRFHKRLHVRNAQTGKPIAQTPHRTPGETTGNDGLKPRHGAIHIQGHSVLGDPAPAPHTDRRHLALIKPDPRQPFDSFTTETELSQHIDHHLLQLTQIPMQICAVAAQIQHRVDHQLPWSVMGHLPTAIDPMQRNGGMSRVEEKVNVRSTPSEGVTGRMLQQPHGFGRPTCL